MKLFVQFLLSLKTAFWLFTAFIVLLFVGSLSLPGNLAFFSGIDETPLFRWLSRSGTISITWWIYVMIAMLAVLAASTLFCTAQAFLSRTGWQAPVLKLSPQVMHIGVLFIMLGHLLTASMGFKMDMLLKQGERAVVAGDRTLLLEDVVVHKDRQGYDADWEAKLIWDDGGNTLTTSLRPLHPRYFGQFGLYSRSVSNGPEKTALVRVCRDPGALWALLGGVLLSIGGVGFLSGKFFTATKTA
jgi:hypothetical protein